MRGGKCVPMMALCLLLCGCGGETEDRTETLLEPYRTMAGCAMEAEVTCGGTEETLTYALRCDYVPGGRSTVEVLSPETAAGIRATVEGEEMALEYEGLCLPVGRQGSGSPAACLPRLMDALRDGWLLEENRETWGETPCLRLTVDRSGIGDGKILSTLWLRLEDGTPLRGEIAVDGEIILTAEFTVFSFCDMMNDQGESGSAAP